MSVTDPPTREGASFTDARTCREWLGALPMTNIPNAQYQVLSGAWTLSDDGTLLLGEDAGPARAEVAEDLLRLTGSEGSLVLERAELR